MSVKKSRVRLDVSGIPEMFWKPIIMQKLVDEWIRAGCPTEFKVVKS